MMFMNNSPKVASLNRPPSTASASFGHRGHRLFSRLHSVGLPECAGIQASGRPTQGADGAWYGTPLYDWPENGGGIFRLKTDGTDGRVLHLVKPSHGDGSSPNLPCALQFPAANGDVIHLLTNPSVRLAGGQARPTAGRSRTPRNCLLSLQPMLAPCLEV
jgi:hypothetical protein